MHLTKEQKEALHPINIIVFFLSVYVIVALVLDTVFRFQGEIHQLLLDIGTKNNHHKSKKGRRSKSTFNFIL